MVSSVLTALYCGGTFFHSPVVTHSLNYQTSGSTHDDSTPCTDIAAGVDVLATNPINSSPSLFMHRLLSFTNRRQWDGDVWDVLYVESVRLESQDPAFCPG